VQRTMLMTVLALGLGAGVGAASALDGPVEKPKEQSEKDKEKEKEKEKKGARPVKKKPKEGGVYTNTDLGPKSSPQPGASPAASTPATTGSTGRAPSADTSSGINPDTGRPWGEDATKAGAEPAATLPETLDEAGWRFQAEARRNALQAAERRVATAQAQLNALMSDMAPTNVMDPNRLQTIEAEKVKVRQELETAKAELEKAKTVWSDFEEAARRKGVPPRWLEPPS
jgi:hypothetical protein